MKLKTGILMLLVGMVIIGMLASSVSAGNWAWCKVTKGSASSQDDDYQRYTPYSHAVCSLSNGQGFYDGYWKGGMINPITGKKSLRDSGSEDCTNANGERLNVYFYGTFNSHNKQCY